MLPIPDVVEGDPLSLPWYLKLMELMKGLLSPYEELRGNQHECLVRLCLAYFTVANSIGLKSSAQTGTPDGHFVKGFYQLLPRGTPSSGKGKD